MTPPDDPAPWRGDVWSCAVPLAGPHPVVVMTANAIAAPLSAVTVVLVTGSAGPAATHVQLGAEAGLTGRPESYANCADVHTVAKARLHRRLGRLSPGELRAVETRLRLALGL